MNEHLQEPLKSLFCKKDHLLGFKASPLPPLLSKPLLIICLPPLVCYEPIYTVVISFEKHKQTRAAQLEETL